MDINLFSDYHISENGDVYSLKSGSNKKLVQSMNSGYLCVTLCQQGVRKTIRVHRLVAYKYLPKTTAKKYQVRHLDGNPFNNHYTNLAWGTGKENSEDQDRHGRLHRGVSHCNALLTQPQVDRIRFLRGKVPYGYWTCLARSLGVSYCTIYSVLHNRTYREARP
jgi:hypothetical protein